MAQQSSGSLKWLLIILVIVILAAFGVYYFYVLKPAQGTVSASPSPTATISSQALIYTNQDYKFTLNLPSSWQGYEMKKTTSPGTTAFYTMDLPSKAVSGGVYEAFYLYVYTPDQWKTVEKQEGPKPTLINQNSQYVFASGFNTGAPTSDWKDNSTISSDYLTQSVFATFKFTQ